MAFNEERSHPNGWNKEKLVSRYVTCLLYTSDAADD